jgi:hypothetical protein
MGIAIEVLPIGPVAVATRGWQSRGRRLFTVIVKVTCTIEHDGHMSVIAPAPIATEERHYRRNPVASLTRGSDLALLVPKPEVVVVGSAHAAPGRELTQTTVRLAVQRDNTMLINKRLEIFGDRRARPGQEPPPPAPFRSIPIQYERALGGIASRENPVGIGMAVDADGLLTHPNVVLPGQGGALPAGFGPIPSAWPIRQKRRGSMSWSNANSAADVEVPADFDDAYYQTAPADQQTQDIRGGDLIAIVNMHPDIPMLRTYLPKGRGVAMAQTARGDRLPLALRIDTVHLEPDAMRAEIVYRGASVISERDFADLRVAGTIEQPDAPFNFPDLSTVSGLVARASKPGAEQTASLDFSSTAVIADETTAAPEARGFTSTQVLEVDAAPAAPRPVVPVVAVAPMPAAAPRGLGGTMVIEPDPTPATPVMPKKEAAPPPAVEVPVSVPKSPRRGRTPPPFERVPRASTLIIETEATPLSLPFEKGMRAPRGEPAPKDGTPWADAAPKAPPRVDLRREPEDLGKTMPLSSGGAFDDEPTFDREVPVLTKAEPFDRRSTGAKSSSKFPAVRPEAKPEEKAPEKPAEPKGSPWREDPVEAPAPKAAPKVAPQRANLKGDLYKKLKR